MTENTALNALYRQYEDEKRRFRHKNDVTDIEIEEV